MTNPVPPRVAVIGATMVDLIAYTDVCPRAGETLIGSHFELGFGGKGANQACMAKLLGADVTFVNRMGDDVFGSLTREHLATKGLHRHLGAPVPGVATGVAPIWVESSGVNRIIVVPGANGSVTPDVVRDELGGMHHLDVVVCQLEVPQDATRESFRVGREVGATNVLNPAPAGDLDDDLLELVDWFVPNETEFESLFGEAPTDASITRAARQIRGRLVVTLGADGAAVWDDGEVIRIPALQVEAVDTTGAGDAFVGGFAYALARGENVAAAVQLGTVCGSLSTAARGTQSSFPDAEAVWAQLDRLPDPGARR